MGYEVRVIEGGIVEVVHTGVMSQTEVQQARDEAAVLVAGLDPHLLLADISAAVVPDETVALFEFNASHYDVLPPNTHIATLFAESTDPSTLLPFAETVALNRGIRFRMFTDHRAALAWLKDNG